MILSYDLDVSKESSEDALNIPSGTLMAFTKKVLAEENRLSKEGALESESYITLLLRHLKDTPEQYQGGVLIGFAMIGLREAVDRLDKHEALKRLLKAGEN
jgi:hypothetical protein